MLDFMKVLWRRWKTLAHGIIGAQNWLIMAVAYVVAMGPVAVVMRLKSGSLLDRGLGDPEATSYWISMDEPNQDIRRSQRPW